MKSKGKLTAALGVTAVGVMVAVQLSPATAGSDEKRELPTVCKKRPGRTADIATAKLIIENNATDEDLGVHGAFDDDGWSELCVFAPDGRPIAVFDPRGQLNDLTMAGVFFESREPPISDFSMKDLAAVFPEGMYRVRGRSFDGRTLVGSARFTHDVPAAPTITAPALAEDPEKPGAPVSRKGLVVDWKPVKETVTGEAVSISGYEVIVTKEEHEDPHGFSQPIYDVHVRPSVNALRVPAQFLESDTLYELEVLSLEESGNQTISVGFFKTN